MNFETLRSHLDKLSSITNAEWMQSLSPRKCAELEFHNRDRDRKLKSSLSQDDFEKYYGNKKYYSAVRRSVQFTDDWIIANAHGKVFLDYACGNGSNAIKAAKAGAALAIGIDISSVSVENARADAAALGLTNVVFLQADAERTLLPASSIDVIICSGMLHHLDLSYAFVELRRILAPGGKILAIEALNYNPFIRLYRMLTPAMRTDWEKNHILGFSDIRFAKRFFDVRSIRFWHVLGYAGAHIPIPMQALDALDRVLEWIPGVRLLAWIFTFELRSRKTPDDLGDNSIETVPQGEAKTAG